MYSSDRCGFHPYLFYASLKVRAGVIAVMVLLTSCATPPPQTNRAETEPVQLETIEQSAAELERQAELALNPYEANHFRVLAALAWMQEGDIGRATSQLGKVDSSQLAAEDNYRFYTVQLRALLAENQQLRALELVRQTTLEESATVEIFNQWLIASADTYYQNYQFQNAAGIYHNCSEPIWSNREQCRQGLWKSLSYLDDTGLDDLTTQESNPSLRGWIELARVAQLNLGEYAIQSDALQQWLNRYPIHTAAMNMPAALQSLGDYAASAPQNIAVLLPLSGPLEPFGNDILEGILSAYYASASRASLTPNITIYDTESLPLDLLIEILRSENFDGVIGPLERERVEQLANTPRLGIPTVALNQLNTANANIVGINLAVESEARQIAEKAAREGHHTAIIMAPNSSGGDRSANTFATSWQNLDQSVSAILRYSENADQRATMLASALHIDQSSQRQSRLQTLLGKQLNFEPRRRADVDMMFMSASPDQARQITPLMAFNYAEDVPVYGTSNIYAGSLNTDLDRDLDGVSLLTYPWVFHTDERLSSLPDPLAALSQDSKSLQALGVDAYYLLRRFHQLQSYPDTIYQGLTGTLYLDGSGNIERRMPWATFRAGQIIQVSP